MKTKTKQNNLSNPMNKNKKTKTTIKLTPFM
jgi:hypothetical protein